MDSKSGRLPFSKSGSRSSYTTPSSYSASSSSLGSSRLYGRERLLSNERFPRSSTSVKPEPDFKASRYLSSSREYGGGSSLSDSRAPSWKVPSSSTSYALPRTSSTLCSQDKMAPERRLGSYSGLLASDDGESKRAKLSYSSRAAYPRTTTTTPTTSSSSSSTTRALYYSSRFSSSTDPSDKRTDRWSDVSLRRSSGLSSSSSRPPSSSSSTSSWSSSSSYLSARRDAERRAGLQSELQSELTVRRVLGSGTTSTSSSSSSSLYPSDRLTSSYAQGARPKETLYSSTSSSSSSMARESSLGCCHLPSSSSSYQTSARSLRSSSGLRPAHQEATVCPSPPSPPLPSSSTWHGSFPHGRRSDTAAPPPPCPPSPSPPPTPPSSPAPAPAPRPDGRLSNRRFFPCLFSHRSGQDSSSSSSSSTSSSSTSTPSSSSPPAVPRPRAAPNTLAPPPSSTPLAAAGGGGAEPEPRDLDTVQAFAFLRRRRQDLTPIPETPRQAGAGGGGTGSSSSSSSSSWLSRCPPLFSRHRRGENAAEQILRQLHRPTVAPDPQPSDDEEDDDDEEEDDDDDDVVEVAGGAFGAAGPGGVILLRPTRNVCRERGPAPSSTPTATSLYRDLLVGVDPRYQAEGQGKAQEARPDLSRDPERLRKIQESLMLEDSDEEEGDLCRICQMGEESPVNPLIQPCRCTGSLQFVHQDCIKKWLRSKISSGTSLEAITTCELCKEKLHLNIDNFDVSELYRTHVQSEYEIVSSGLYLVVLLHLCEQRFTDVLGAANEAGFFNLARSLHEHMDILESPHREGEEDEDDDDDDDDDEDDVAGVASVHDSRPSINFSDLEDELDEEY